MMSSNSFYHVEVSVPSHGAGDAFAKETVSSQPILPDYLTCNTPDNNNNKKMFDLLLSYHVDGAKDW